MDQREQDRRIPEITIEKMAQEAERELEAIRHPGARAAARNFAKKALGRSASGKDPIFWPAGLLMLGLLEAGHEDAVRRYLDEWIRDGMVVRHPDDALTGEVLLRLYERETGKEKGGEEGRRNKSPKSCSGFRTGTERKEQAGQSGDGDDGGQDRDRAGAGQDRGRAGTWQDRDRADAGQAREDRDGRGDRECSCSIYKEAADRILGYLRNCRRDCCGSIVYGQASSNNYIFADGVGQMALFLSHYGRLFDDENGRYAREQAKRELTNFLQHGMDERSGLPYHGYDAETGMKCGIIGWGRAVGWLLMGMVEYCTDVPGEGSDSCQAGYSAGFPAGSDKNSGSNSEYERVSCSESGCEQNSEYHSGLGSENPLPGEVIQKLTDACMGRVRKDGLFSWQLDCLDGPADTSATGMIDWALLKMDLQQPDAAAEALVQHVDAGGRVGQASAECIDFGQYRQVYGNYPWGQGAALMFLAAREKLEVREQQPL